jgi:hypothetical protein
MICERAEAAGIAELIGGHTFRATGITASSPMAAPESPGATTLCYRHETAQRESPVANGLFSDEPYLSRVTMGVWVNNNSLNRTSWWNAGTSGRDLVVHNWDLITRARG